VALALSSRGRTLAVGASIVFAMALAAAVLGRSCAVGDPNPADAVRAFLTAARAQDRAAVYRLLGPATQKQLDERARAATDLVGSNLRYTAIDLISLGTFEDVAAHDVRVIEEGGEDAGVEIAGEAGKARLELVHVDGDWRIELLDGR
jgi:hypothetical protein